MKSAILAALLKLRSIPVEDRFSLPRGICSFVHDCVVGPHTEDTDDELVDRLLVPLFRTWPEFSGRDSYPVTHKACMSEYSGFWHTPIAEFWTGHYGEARCRLLDHMIVTLQAQLASEV